MSEAITEHISDCALHEGNLCDCGGLDLALYELHDFVPTRIPATGRFGFFVNHMGRECFVEPEHLPPLTLAAIAAASDLPDTHNTVAVLRCTDCMDLDYAREAVVSKLKASPTR
ncbi:hypothetical protein PMI07_002362 [Rhizobium sp. CF080]|uniref:hypothetical protein n=1 Tax=Rhizobium sp. (strain CF080) TaxID=1144310 RepID=UPI0002716FD2|nr:hypothetical protein [Rhizobium sp. CF080]EUB95874.1 hypothetical protein PMI07_002362 [Rhizobium sp. CF080]